jgi:hypothetical protein
MQCSQNGLARSRLEHNGRVRRSTVAVGSRKCRMPRRGQRAWVLDEWFHEIRSDEDGIFVTYRKESQARDSFGRPWREDGDKDVQIQPWRAFDRAGLVLVWDDTYYSTLYMAREPALAETNGASGGGAARSAC